MVFCEFDLHEFDCNTEFRASFKKGPHWPQIGHEYGFRLRLVLSLIFRPNVCAVFMFLSCPTVALFSDTVTLALLLHYLGGIKATNLFCPKLTVEATRSSNQLHICPLPCDRAASHTCAQNCLLFVRLRKGGSRLVGRVCSSHCAIGSGREQDIVSETLRNLLCVSCVLMLELFCCLWIGLFVFDLFFVSCYNGLKAKATGRGVQSWADRKPRGTLL